jgi:hypothetical protein
MAKCGGCFLFPDVGSGGSFFLEADKMKLRFEWSEFADAALDGLRSRGYKPKSMPVVLWRPGTAYPESVEIEINERKLPHEISIF